MTDPVAVQIGGGRNGQNPYKAVCQKFGLQFWLVETPEFIDLQGRQGYTLPHNLIALPEAHVPEAVLRTLSQRGIQPFIVMPGFERYGLCAAKVSEKLNCLPYGQFPFLPRNKQEQKNLLDDVFPHTASLTADDFAANERLLDNLSFPVVIKPFDGAGGLGVYLADDLAAVKTALGLLEHTANYGGGEFDGILIEEFVPGPEQSVQGVVIGGKVHTLSMGTKLVFKEPIAPGLAQFREAGLVLVGPSHIPPDVLQFVTKCMQLMDYKAGAFHIDFKTTPKGTIVFEIGFRPSGFGITELTKAVSGWDVWEAAFLAMADLTYIPNEPTLPQSSVGELRLRLEPELSKAYAVMAPPQGSIQVTKHKPGPQDLPGVLASERRHTGTIATVRATGSPEAVRAALQACLTERLALQIQ